MHQVLLEGNIGKTTYALCDPALLRLRTYKHLYVDLCLTIVRQCLTCDL